MSTYARLKADLSFDRLVELSPEQYTALQANGKAAWLRLYVVDAQPVPSSTQLVIDGPYVSDATTTHRTFVLVDKTAQHLASEAQQAALVLLQQAVAVLQADIATGITPAPTTAAQAFLEVQDLKRRALRSDRILLWILRQQT